MKQVRDVVILIADGIPDRNGDFFDNTSVISCDQSEVPLISAHGDIVGSAILQMTLKPPLHFCVTLQFFDSVKPYLHGFKPCFTGNCISRMAGHVLEAKLTSVMIANENSDVRIPTLGSYFGYDDKPVTKLDPTVCRCERLMNGHEPSCGWKASRG